MAGNGLFPIQFAVVISRFNTTFDDAPFIPKAIGTQATFNNRRYPAKLLIVYKKALLFQFHPAFGSKVGQNGGKVFPHNFHFIFCYRRTGIAILAAAAFAARQVAYKFSFHYFICQQHIIYLDHGTKITPACGIEQI